MFHRICCCLVAMWAKAPLKKVLNLTESYIAHELPRLFTPVVLLASIHEVVRHKYRNWTHQILLHLWSDPVCLCMSAAGPVGTGVGTHSTLFQHVCQTRPDCVWPPLAPAGRQCRRQTGTVKVLTVHGDVHFPLSLPSNGSVHCNQHKWQLFVSAPCSVFPSSAVTHRGRRCPVNAFFSALSGIFTSWRLLTTYFPSNGIIIQGA